jgi:hypothetical protein
MLRYVHLYACCTPSQHLAHAIRAAVTVGYTGSVVSLYESTEP